AALQQAHRCTSREWRAVRCDGRQVDLEFSVALCVQCLFPEFHATLLFALAGVSKFKSRVFVGKRILVPLECRHAQQPVARGRGSVEVSAVRSEEHTSELQSLAYL